jgi:hypothetical protein
MDMGKKKKICRDIFIFFMKAIFAFELPVAASHLLPIQ